jgi:Domain of unknown function (DUF1707)
MSEDLVPDRRSLRVSHEDRDQVVEQLRVAAGDGRLTAEELDERLETALSARTYGELETLLVDLPASRIPGGTLLPHTAASKELVQLKARSGNIQRIGPWIVPRRIEAEVRSGNATIDFTQAVITHPVLELAVALRSGNLRLIVPPDVVVDMDSVEVRSGSVRQRARHEPGTPVRLMVTVSGSVRSGSVVVRGPRRGFWDWLLRRHPVLPGVTPMPGR